VADRVCPYWKGFWLTSPLRRIIHRPEWILAPYVERGSTVLEVGPAMGFFTLPLARMVGPTGRVVCVDVEERMLRTLAKRARRAGLAERIVCRTCPPDSLGVDDLAGQVDFALVFYVVHEVPDAGRLFAELAHALSPDAACLVAEPKGRVKGRDFAASLDAAQRSGFTVTGAPKIPWSHTALLQKNRGGPPLGA
jgi:ubiquinone/menaquinone biosynthesis C-methylase UbiE